MSRFKEMGVIWVVSLRLKGASPYVLAQTSEFGRSKQDDTSMYITLNTRVRYVVETEYVSLWVCDSRGLRVHLVTSILLWNEI